MTRRKVNNHGIIGWLIVFAVVFFFDYWAISNRKQTMSQAFKKALYMKSAFLPVLVGWLLLTWHLVHTSKMRNTDLFSVVFDKKKEKMWQI
jgi:hypothetical protein